METLVPILLSLFLGLALGITAGVPLVGNLCNGVYTERSADIQKNNEAVTFGHLEATTDSYDINERLLATDLFNGQVIDVEVYPQAKAQADAGAIAGYTCLLLSVALLAVAGQSVTVMRARPAQILLGRR